MLNIHHLELFYYVARHGGISEAVRNIPYGIQQPAISSQILLLEESLGTKLFQRRPFQLLPPGEKLFAFIAPFFGGVEGVADEIRGHSSHLVRLGASSVILRNYFPEIIQTARASLPGLRLTIHDGIEPQLIRALEKQDIDLAITALPPNLPGGFNHAPLVRLPLVLLVPASSKMKSASELFKRDKVEEPLICLPANESITRNFQAGMQERGVEWLAPFVVNALDLIDTYAAAGLGIGISVVVPGVKLRAGLRRLPLEGFEPVTMAAVWAGELSPALETMLALFKRRAGELAGETEA